MPKGEEYDALGSEGLNHGGLDDLELLPTICLVHVPHAKIPDLFQCCYDYIDPWEWSQTTERVETGRWFFGSAGEE